MKKIILWRNRPIDVDIQLWNEIAKQFDGEVVVLYSEGILKERCSTGVAANDFDVFSFKSKKVDYKLDRDYLLNQALCDENINIFFGFDKKFLIYLDAIKKNNKKFAVIAEMPKFYARKSFRLLKNILLFLKYRLLSLKYRRSISLFFAYGIDGVKAYKRLKFNEESLYPIMYNSEYECHLGENESKQLKIVYVGRFEYNFKGIDLIINAVKDIANENIQLDLVGGYGKNKDDVLQSIKNCTNIHFLGTWQQSEVVTNMSRYDLCIVPSRCDGWNINVNHSIKAGIGCVASDRCVSYELINYAKNGVVIHANKKDIISVLRCALDNPQEVKRWKENARKYAPQLETAKFAKYVLDCIEMQFNIKEKKEIKPSWITK